MYRYQILIEYVGTNFVGWQIQSKGKSIQKLIQAKFSKILKEKILIIGSGRTDSGVHATEQSAHFECKKAIKNLDKFLKSVNYFLNNMNISITKIKKRTATKTCRRLRLPPTTPFTTTPLRNFTLTFFTYAQNLMIRSFFYQK